MEPNRGRGIQSHLGGEVGVREQSPGWGVGVSVFTERLLHPHSPPPRGDDKKRECHRPGALTFYPAAHPACRSQESVPPPQGSGRQDRVGSDLGARVPRDGHCMARVPPGPVWCCGQGSSSWRVTAQSPAFLKAFCTRTCTQCCGSWFGPTAGPFAVRHGWLFVHEGPNQGSQLQLTEAEKQ